MGSVEPTDRWAWLAALVAVQLSLVPAWVAGQGSLVSLDGLLVLFVARASGRVEVALAVGAVALVWEVVRAFGAVLMHQDPLLFDVVYLLRHLWVLSADLLGALSLPLILGLVAALGALVVGQLALVRRARVPLPPVGLMACFGFLGWALGLPVRFGLGELPGNLLASTRVAAEVDGMLAEARARPLPTVTWDAFPDVEVVVVESYGRVLFDRKRPQEAWTSDVRPLQKAALRRGFTVVSGFVRSTVSGGRSWLADASLLTGLPIAHEAVYQEAMAVAHELPHVPRVFQRAGYETVVVRPKNRARPGVELVNELSMLRTVYFAELGYDGAEQGWGWVPDQYTLGWLREHVLVEEGRPRFVFAHLVSSHAPWHEVPEVVDDWRTLNTGEGAFEEERGAFEELMVQLGRFQRRDGHRGKRKLGADHMSRYSEAIGYDLAVLAEHVEAAVDRPKVLVILGDHQPPMVTPGARFDVPVHVLVSEPRWAEPFRRRGFVDGWMPSGDATLGLEELAPALLGG